MSIYGETIAEFRQRPALWRMALVALSQLVIGATIANLLLAGCDATILIHAGIAKAVILRLTDWMPLRGFDALHAVIAIGFLIVAEIVLDFLPAPHGLASRHFVIAVAQSLAAFGAGVLALNQPLIPAMVIALAAALMCVRAEVAAIRLLSNVLDMQLPLHRVTLWLLRIGLWSAAALLPLSIRWPLLGFAAVTLFVNLSTKPKDAWQRVDDPQMREATATLPIVAALLVAAAIWMAPRVVIISTHGASIRPWKPIASDLAKRLRDREARR